jgi:hypothetical protein
MKNYLKKYEMLWSVVKDLNWTPDSDYDEVQSLLIKSMSLEQSTQLNKELEEVQKFLSERIPENKVYKFTKGREEEGYIIFYNIIAMGYDKTIDALEDKKEFWDNINENVLYSNFASVIPFEYDYNDVKEEDSLQKMFDLSIEKIEIMKKADHLSTRYKDLIEKETLDFVKKTKDFISGKLTGYDRDVFYKEISDFSDKSRWAKDVILESINKSQRNLNRSEQKGEIIGYGYPNSIEQSIINEKQKNQIIILEKYDEKYIEEFDKNKVVDFLSVRKSKSKNNTNNTNKI